ncbi:SDR family oxidoreductase [Paenibacillus sp. J5C_2022]|uniref:SDR family oxidoreductase n=1 Tax=Paenibacillus sp. J5C2022 TaxID=2977129 RepID=UPI0021D27FA3|nr:SDR family oxidoreductase [Paenibacillus sp. J5C2022]MCU6708877.1 SDR family oxidoreductase [Paenibacillus sp. J5C2022]
MYNVVLITGASTGVGLETSLLLASKGYKVYSTMRDVTKKERLLEAAHQKQVDVTVKQLDVTSSESVNRCVQEILDEQGHIDILVNNAGVGFIRTTEQATEEEIQWQLDVNLMGVMRCTKAVLPSMRQRRSGRVINITSVGGLVGQPFNEFYCAAKFGVEGYTESLASYVQPHFQIKFTAIEPGGIVSEFTNNVLQQFQGSGGMKDDEYAPLLNQYIQGTQSRASEGIYQTSEEVARVILSCMEMDEPPVRMRTSPWAEQFTRLKTESDPSGKKLQQQITTALLGKQD